MKNLFFALAVAGMATTAASPASAFMFPYELWEKLVNKPSVDEVITKGDVASRTG